MLKANAITKTKDNIIKYLQEFFANKSNYSEYGLDLSEVEIFDKQPLILQNYPSILITAINGNYITSGLGDISQEIYDDDGECIGYRYSGMLELPVTIEVASRTTPERDRLIDLLSITLRVLIRRQLEYEGILIKDMHYGGESEIMYDSDKLYIASIQFTTWSEWYQDVTFLPLKGIDIEYDNNPQR